MLREFTVIIKIDSALLKVIMMFKDRERALCRSGLSMW